MPIYEFRCRECGTRFEALRRVGEDGRTLECPDCGTPRPEKVFSTFAAGACGNASSGFG